MDVILVSVVLFFILALLIILLIFLFLQFHKSQSKINDISIIVQNLAQNIQNEHTFIATLNEKVLSLTEKIARLEPVTQIQQESKISLVELKTLANNIANSTSNMQQELAHAKNDLAKIQTRAEVRQELETKTAESIRRLEAIIAGTQSKGMAGENIVESLLSKLPIEWQVRNFRIGGKSVEFGLCLPNNLILPIDSKWPATNLLEQFLATNDENEKKKLKHDIEKTVEKKAGEVAKYIDPSLTANFGLAVIPDAIYEFCYEIQIDIFQKHQIILVSYSMFLPYLLLIIQTTLKSEQTIDMQKLSAHIQTIYSNMQLLQDLLDGQFPKEITTLNNLSDKMRKYIRQIQTSLTSIQTISKETMASSEINT